MTNSASLLHDEDYKNVQGWMNPNVPTLVDAWASYYTEELQSEFASTLEIGVHHGRFFLILESVTPSSSKCYGYDLFEHLQDYNIDGSGQGNKEIFESHVAAIAKHQDRVIPVQGDSFSIREAALSHKYSLISIDGGHTREHTLFDLQYANDTITPGGLIVLDDFINWNWLGVVEGALDFLNGTNRRICPFMAGYNKLFLTTISEADSVRKAIEARIPEKMNMLSPLKGHVVRGLR